VWSDGVRCPICAGKLERRGHALSCQDCGHEHPIVRDVPVLLNEERSVFTADEVAAAGPAAFDASAAPWWRTTLGNAIPGITVNLTAPRILRELEARLPAGARVLVIGGGILGAGMEALVANTALDVVESDVFLGPRTAVLFDAHDIPYEDATFDAVIAQAVLEHVADPWRCVEEITRVLKDGGTVYAETPFMQQVHGGAYDFTRFSLLGHRRLFRRFEEVESGMAVGPGSALAWSWTYFLASFARSRRQRAAAHLLGRLTGFFWVWFDHRLAGRDAANDAASGVYFVGTKARDGWTLPDRVLVAGYRGIHD
jgi:SAM-dependent methyltransferase